MAKNFDNITIDTSLTNEDKILVGQESGSDVGVNMSEVKRFVSNPLEDNFKNGVIIPMYIYPEDAYNNTDYNSIISYRRQNRTVPMIVVINPSSGPGTSTDGNYTMVIDRMKAVGIHVIGYVSTDYRANTVEDVKADIDGWKTYYPGIEGIFFDEQSDGTTDLNAEQDYYNSLAEYSRLNGFNITVSNPGKDVDNSWYDLFDILIEFENDTWPTTGTMDGAWPGGKQILKRGGLKHSSTTGDLSGGDAAIFDEFLEYFGWVYVTEDILPNPWDSVSSEMQDIYNAIG